MVFAVQSFLGYNIFASGVWHLVYILIKTQVPKLYSTEYYFSEIIMANKHILKMIKTELRRVKSFVQGDSVNFNLSLLRVGLNKI